ncbi:MAG: helix-turn-helix domain-containing protein [Chlamydiales bacterium]|nr:helix-turn-helix domain-containing protein [Chlamydiales bacterium]
MAKGYRHLTYEQRCQIYILKESKNSPAKIARILKVDRSTIHRELKHNGNMIRYKRALSVLI